MTKASEYELITRAIFQSLVDQDEARNIVVEHDVTLPGKFLKHQVDVYWKFERAGIEYATVVECKDWNRALEQEKLLAFRAKLEELNNPTGIMVTRSGYQKGALEYANKHGIYLYQLFEEPPLVLKAGSFATIKATPYVMRQAGIPETTSVRLVAEWTVYEPEYSKNTYHPDNDWVQEQVRCVGEHLRVELQQFTVPKQPLHDLKLYDEWENEVGNVLAVFTKKCQEMLNNGVTNDNFVHRFSDPTFLRIDLESLPYLKITGLSTEIAIAKHDPFERVMKPEGFVHFILKSLRDDCERVMAVKKRQ
jgi:hypothetical protein